MASISYAVKLHQDGNLAEAERAYVGVLSSQPNHSDALHLLGVIRQQQGRHEEALELIGRAIAHNPAKAVYHNNYGAALLSLERFADAKESFQTALRICPKYPDALANLGLAETALGREEAALACFRQALAIDPRHRDSRRRMAALLFDLDRVDEAAAVLQDALAASPTAAAYADFGDLCLKAGRPQDAVAAYRKAVELDASQAGMHLNLSQALDEVHDTAGARRHFARAAELRPEKRLWRLRAEVCGPLVFESSEEIEEYCQRVERALSGSAEQGAGSRDEERGREWGKGRERAGTLDEILEAGVFPGFGLSYLGRNVRRMKEQFATLYEPCFSDFARWSPAFKRHAAVTEGKPAEAGTPAHPHPLPLSRQERGAKKDRPRVGFLVTRRHEGIFARCMAGIINRLDSRQFEIVILTSRASVDVLKNRLASDRLKYVHFSDTFGDAVRQIRGAVCDLIYYWEVGSDALNYFLPFARLAPVQCTSHGSLTTTGNPAIDYFFSSSLMEQPSPPAPLPEGEGSNAHYSERLWLSRTLLMCQDRLTPVRASRGYWRLPEDRRLYGCLQNPLKLHPDFDHLLAGILAADPLGTIVLLADEFRYAVAALRKRFAKHVAHADSILFVPRQNFVDYCGLLTVCDVLLDPLHYGAGSSCYDIFSFNLPMVTLPTDLMPGRVALGFYRKMAFEELVASSADDYVRKAVQVATDRDYRRHVTERIAERSDVIFNDLEAVREHERFFDETGSDHARMGR